MSANTVWDSPATLVLLAVAAANVLLPVAHFWPDSGPTEAPAAESRQDAAGAPARVTAPSGPVDAIGQTPAAEGRGDGDPPAPRLAPVITPELAKRVSLRRSTPVCRAWGPFTTLEEAESLARRLGLPGQDFEVFESEVAADPDYLVTVRAPGSRDAAERVLEELDGRGIDSYLLRRGPVPPAFWPPACSAARSGRTPKRSAGNSPIWATKPVVEPLQRAHQVPITSWPGSCRPQPILQIPPAGRLRRHCTPGTVSIEFRSHFGRHSSAGRAAHL